MPGNLTPEQRALRARMGAYAAMAKHGRSKITEAARAANPSNDNYWLAKADPEAELPEDERRQRAADLKTSYFAGLAFKSARARKRAS